MKLETIPEEGQGSLSSEERKKKCPVKGSTCLEFAVENLDSLVIVPAMDMKEKRRCWDLRPVEGLFRSP